MPEPAFILDMDGVIIDSNPVHLEVWLRYVRRFGIETDGDVAQRIYGRRNDEIVCDFFGPRVTPEEVRAHGAAKERVYREVVGARVEEFLVPGVREFLERHARSPIGLATNAEAANVEFLLEAARLRPYFRAVVDGNQVFHPKPHPEIYLKTADLLGAHPSDCVVFEDSFSGVQAARAAGMRVVGVRTTHAQLAGVDLAIDNFNSPDLEPWLAQR